MKVLFTPDYSDGNPYQRLLATALEQFDVEVEAGWGKGTWPLHGLLDRYGEPDVLHLHWPHPFIRGSSWFQMVKNSTKFLLELSLLRLKGLPLVWTVHNTVDHDAPYPGLERFVRKRLFRLVHRVCVHCPEAMEDITESYGLNEEAKDNMLVTRHGSYRGWYPDRVDREEARRALDLPQDPFVYLHLGSLRRYRGLLTLINTFDQLDRSRTRLVIAGTSDDEPFVEEVRARCDENDRARLDEDFVSGEEMQYYFRAADVGVYPFRRILTSGSIMLALTFGTPVIVPNLGCLPDMVGKAGLMYDSEDEGALLAQMQRALEDPLNKRAKIARRIARKSNWKRPAQKLHNLYRDLTDSS